MYGSGDIRIGLPHVDRTWSAVIDKAERGEPSRFRNNGFVVAALQTACSVRRGYPDRQSRPRQERLATVLGASTAD